MFKKWNYRIGVRGKVTHYVNHYNTILLRLIGNVSTSNYFIEIMSPIIK